jgi:hypothetical protein
LTQEGLQKGLAEDFEGLAASERGVLLALFACDGDQAILARLDERRRDSCVTAWEILRQLDERTRAEKLEGWRCQAASALPEGLARLHPSWIDDILDGEPEHIAREVRAILPSALRDVSRSDEATLAGGGGDASGQSDEAADEAAKRDLRRLLFVRLEPLCAGACGPRAQVLCGLTFEALLDEVARLGARALGYSLVGQAASVRARAMATVGEPWAAVVGGASTEDVSAAEHKAALVATGTALPSAARTARERLLHMGVAVLKPELRAEHPQSAARVAGRLPVGLGRRLLE